jgi:hypothetical protein
MLLCEVELRVMGGVSYPIFSQIDGGLGASLRPGSEGWYKNECQVYVRISSAGLRDRGHWNKEGHHLAGRLIAQKLCSDVGDPHVQSDDQRKSEN